ncbi:B3 domain-containing protein [Thalictrum thalictroides]|uniref:B3 domain-containing protein n=1 Tax=Thalictrum thalictroides TaxID=46969 RepID=A0A7J6VV66_THATH|nr:B3 domain-containing protein [Thalictrum thalictroides]
MEACQECAKRCLNKNPSSSSSSLLPVFPSFFKVLVDENERFRKFLTIPPKFSPTIMSLVDQKINLEDSKGQRWSVQVSRLGERLVFQHGWDQFASDHFLETGDFLVFSYIIGSHFIVQIYCRSGCPKLNFSEKISQSRESSDAEMSIDPRTSDEKNLTPEDVSPPMNDKSSKNEQGSCSSVHSGWNVDRSQIPCNVPIVEKIPTSTAMKTPCNNNTSKSKPVLDDGCTEVPFYMIDRTFVDVAKVGTCQFDLSEFELVRSSSAEKPIVMKTGRSPNCVAEPVQHQTTQGTDCFEDYCNIFQTRSGDTERQCRRVPLNVSDFGVSERRQLSQDIDKVPLFKEKTSTTGCISRHPERECESGKKALLFKDKISMNVSSSRQTQTGSKNHCAGNGNVNANFNTAFCTPLTEKRKSVFSGMDAVSQLNQNIFAGSSGSDPNMKKKVSGFGNDFSTGGSDYPTGKKMKVIKEEYLEKVEDKHGKRPAAVKCELQEEIYPSLKIQGKASNMVKREYVDSPSPFFSSNDYCSSVFAVTRSFLEFPNDRPAIVGFGRKRMDRKIIIVCDPFRRLWTVLYLQSFGIKVLGKGWATVAKANNIQEGDQCIFEVENGTEGIFGLRIVRK